MEVLSLAGGGLRLDGRPLEKEKGDLVVLAGIAAVVEFVVEK
jgi:hypothetical protein